MSRSRPASSTSLGSVLRRFRPGLHFLTEPIRERRGVLFVVVVGGFTCWGVCGLKSEGHASEGSGVLVRSQVSGGVGDDRSSSSITVPSIGGRDFFRSRLLSRVGVLAGRPANLRADDGAPFGLRAATDVTEKPAEDSGRPIVVGKENMDSVGEK